MTDSSHQLPDEQKTDLLLFALELISKLGFMIAVPIAMFALGGNMLDKTLQTSPAFLLGGIVLASIVTAIWIFRWVRIVRDRYLNMLNAHPTNQKRT